MPREESTNLLPALRKRSSKSKGSVRANSRGATCQYNDHRAALGELFYVFTYFFDMRHRLPMKSGQVVEIEIESEFDVNEEVASIFIYGGRVKKEISTITYTSTVNTNGVRAG